MASLIPGYEYDIFISYRQKDNKGDKWVSEFVEELKTELESTFKEEVSVYFDINPHDGILETYDVDASLKDKLKCLVFIPIISRTYCDPNSFAWKHEFMPYVKAAQQDKFGLKINLPNGNVINRILPVRIHDLEETDIKLVESVLGGVLRGIEFVYKTPGVNRPLRVNEEHPQDNINKTYYRDQINKVANSLREIITSLITGNLQVSQPSRNNTKSRNIEDTKHKTYRPLIISGILLAVILIMILYLYRPKFSKSSEPFEKTIAVLPFEKWFSDKDYSYLGDAVASQISSQLRAVRQLHVISFNSTRRYLPPNIPSIRQIGKECGANILIQGSVELFKGNKEVGIGIQLINAKNNNPFYEDKFKGDLDSLQIIRSRIILKIAQELKIVLSSEEFKIIQTGLTKSSDAYKNFLSADYQDDAASLTLMGKKYQDSTSYERAITMYDKAIMYDSTFALAYARRAISRSWAYFLGSQRSPGTVEKCKKDIDKALKIDPKLPEAQNAYGFYYYYCKKEYQKALDCFRQASIMDPGNWQPLYYIAVVYRRMGEWNKSQTLLTKVLKYNPQDALILINIAASYNYRRDYDSALIYQNQAINVMPNWIDSYGNKISTLLLKYGNTIEARLFIDSASRKTGYRFQRDRILLDIYDFKYKEALIKTELAGPADFYDQGDKSLQYATIHNYLDHPDLAKIYYDSALVYYKKRLREDGENPTNFIQIGHAYAGLKDYLKAMDSAKKAVKLSSDNLSRTENQIEMAQIYIKCGDYPDGIKQVEDLLSRPSNLSVKYLMLDPVWKPVLNNPEFTKLISTYTTK